MFWHFSALIVGPHDRRWPMRDGQLAWRTNDLLFARDWWPMTNAKKCYNISAIKCLSKIAVSCACDAKKWWVVFSSFFLLLLITDPLIMSKWTDWQLVFFIWKENAHKLVQQVGNKSTVKTGYNVAFCSRRIWLYMRIYVITDLNLL